MANEKQVVVSLDPIEGAMLAMAQPCPSCGSHDAKVDRTIAGKLMVLRCYQCGGFIQTLRKADLFHLIRELRTIRRRAASSSSQCAWECVATISDLTFILG